MAAVESSLKKKNVGGLKIEERGSSRFAVKSTNLSQAKILLGLEGEVREVHPDERRPKVHFDRNRRQEG